MRRFAQVIDDLEFVDLPLQGGSFTWSGGLYNQAWARLDRFLVSPSWLNQFSNVIQKRLPRPISDHFPILIEGGGIRRGDVVNGRASYKLATKLKLYNKWNDQVESERRLTEEKISIKKEAKEGYAKWVTWRKYTGDGGLNLNQISQQEAETLEFPFLEDEVHSTLMDMNGDKAPGPDGFTVAFLQCCWEFVKEEVLEMFKEFHEQNSFLKSLNNTFLVLLPKKRGVEELGDFKPICLLGGLYKLLAKVLANRIKKVIGKVVSLNQNAFVVGRQILDTSLIANEVIDSWQKRGEKDLILEGLDVELYPTAKFSVLVNGVLARFFSSSKGLCQGNPLSPYLFIMGMEVLSVLIRRAVEGGFISGCNIWQGSGLVANISHLLFADDTIVFCEAKKEHLTYLSWILCWFETVLGLRINLAKSEIIPVGEVEEILEMAMELGCKVGQLPSGYLGLPFGAPNKASFVWDGVEERMRWKLALWKRQYISKGGRITLNNSTLASMPLYQLSLFCMPKIVAEGEGGAGLEKASPLEQSLVWKMGLEIRSAKDELWKQVLTAKYGQEELGWRTKKANGAFGVGVWKEILKESDWFPQLYVVAAHRNATMGEIWDQNPSQGGWNLRFFRDFNNWELDLVGELLQALRGQRITLEEDSVFWKGGKNRQFGVKNAYSLLISPIVSVFPKNGI
ncbi:LINE-1 reverse transcriptase-like [Vitis vinifera]|uniref:LINE-1 reverse transcriptase-like n=1 Tax=Vitis vinifera TaxID=29760 RepID=A0A438IGN4_VITVI|nr:LINE-1 reverse transcriptase-like [Vitis vinifera]